MGYEDDVEARKMLMIREEKNASTTQDHLEHHYVQVKLWVPVNRTWKVFLKTEVMALLGEHAPESFLYFPNPI